MCVSVVVRGCELLLSRVLYPVRTMKFRLNHDHRQTVDSEAMFTDPVVKLQQFLAAPLFKNNEAPFQPSLATMKKAAKLFVHDNFNKIQLVKSFVYMHDAPSHALPEVLFIGRSNVGKSSLIQALFSTVPNLVRISSTPGKTQTINCFQVGKLFCVCDAPGYGYKQPKHFTDGVETYMQQRRNLVRTFLLVDSKVGFASWDEIALDMLEEFRIPYALVFTKVDKAADSRLIKNVMDLQQIRDKHSSPSCFPQPFLVSSLTGEGVGVLMAFIAHITGHLSEVD